MSIDSHIKKIIGDIPILYINLERTNDRRDKLEKILNENDLKFTRIEAIDGNEIDVESLKSQYIINPKMNKYEIACALSHHKAIEEVKLKKYEVALILEDDCNFEYIKYKTLPLSELVKIKDDWETIQIAGIYTKKRFFEMANFQEELLKINDSGAMAYLINQKGVNKILKNFHETKKLNVSEHNMFLITKNYMTKPYLTYYNYQTIRSTIRDNTKSANMIQILSKIWWDDYYSKLSSQSPQEEALDSSKLKQEESK
jgi:GR25 family glycosyltransferase involved in LPS biosynthesis